MRIIQTPNMPKSNGHYSQCIEHNGMLYLSGQLPFHPITRVKPEGVKDQTRQVLENIKLILAEAGSDLQKVIQMRLYIPDVGLWDDVNEVYSEFFGDHKPVRCVVPTRALHFDSLIEVEATAYV